MGSLMAFALQLMEMLQTRMGRAIKPKNHHKCWCLHGIVASANMASHLLCLETLLSTSIINTTTKAKGVDGPTNT